MGEAGLRYGITPPQMKEIRHLDKENKTLKELLAEKDQNEEMSILVDSIIKGISSISLESLLLNSYATMLAIESLKTNQSYTIKLSYLK